MVILNAQDPIVTLIEDQKLVPIYGRGKTTSDPRSHIMNIPNRPVFGPRPQTIPTLDINYFLSLWGFHHSIHVDANKFFINMFLFPLSSFLNFVN